MSKLFKRNAEKLNRGNNVFIGKMVDDSYIVLLKGDKALVPLVVSNVEVPRVGSQTYVFVDGEFNETALKSIVVGVLNLAEVSVSKTVLVHPMSWTDHKLEVVDVYVQTLHDKGVVSLPEKDVKDFLGKLGFDTSFAYPKIVHNVSAVLATKVFDSSRTTYVSDYEELKEKNKKDTSFIELTDPKLLNTYKSVTAGVVNNVLFTGDAGTGKTSAYLKMAAMADAVPLSFNASTNVDEDFVFGSYVINNDPDIPNKYKWLYGMFALAYKHGYWLLIDEVNLLQDGGVLGPLNNALVAPYKLVLANGEVIYKHPNTRVFFAMNVGYTHTYELNQALADRMERKYRFPDITLEEASKRLQSKLSFNNRRVVEKLFDIYTSLKALAVQEGITSVISYRGIESCISQAEVTGDIEDALDATLFESIYYTVTEKSVVDTAKSSLSKDIAQLKAAYTGKVESNDEDTSFIFDASPSPDEDDTNSLLEELDNL